MTGWLMSGRSGDARDMEALSRFSSGRHATTVWDVTESASRNGRDHEGEWVVSVTTNLSVDKENVEEDAEVVKNSDGTITYVKRFEIPPRSPGRSCFSQFLCGGTVGVNDRFGAASLTGYAATGSRLAERRRRPSPEDDHGT